MTAIDRWLDSHTGAASVGQIGDRVPSNAINQRWVFGKHAALDFSSDPPVGGVASQINTYEGSASIADFGGNLLFYTDGSTVWDANGAVRASGLQGHQYSTQSAIIVRDPAMAGRYYVFTADGSSGTNKHFNGIRLDTNPPTWVAVLLSNLTTLPPTTGKSPTEKLTAVPHANCKDFWIITIVQEGALNLAIGEAAFRVFLLTASGLVHVGDTPIVPKVSDLGYLKANGARTRLGLANWHGQEVLVYDFSNTTGTISNLVQIPVPAVIVTTHLRTPYGLEFSPNGDVLYYTALGNPDTGGGVGSDFLFQVDLTSAPVSTELLQYFNAGSKGHALGALQLGVDGRIYMAKDGEAQLGAIQNPDIVGPGCNVNPAFVNLPSGTRCQLGLPNLLSAPCPQQFDGTCEEVSEQVDTHLSKLSYTRSNRLEPCSGPAEPCHCSGESDEKPRCEELPRPDVRPCITVTWGDSACDCMETDDVEVAYITVCNCYSNVTFSNFSIGYIRVYDSEGQPVPTLPDGSPSVAVVPAGPICFGDIGPCIPGGANCVSREFVVITRGAKGGKFQIEVGTLCYDVCFHYQDKACFTLELCQDN